jgi:large subunit ribosomal protein L17
MHRHGYKGRKFGRERDQREALIKGLADSLIIHESIETTLEKAKDLRPYVEKLVTIAIKGGLHNRRQVIKSLQTLEAAHKLVDEIAPKIQRTSGYLRIIKTTARRGDNAQLARISFVDDLQKAPVASSKVNTKPTKTETIAALKKSTAKKEARS